MELVYFDIPDDNVYSRWPGKMARDVEARDEVYGKIAIGPVELRTTMTGLYKVNY